MLDIVTSKPLKVYCEMLLVMYTLYNMQHYYFHGHFKY